MKTTHTNAEANTAQDVRNHTNPLNNEERKVIDSASRKPFAWHGYKLGSGYSKILSALNKKGIIQFHPTQNLFRILPSALKR